MVFSQTFRELEAYTEANCPDYFPDGWHRLAVLLNYFSLWLTLVLWVGTFKYKELYLFFFSLAITLGSLLNAGLQHVIRESPITPGCGDTFENPSLITQTAFFFVATIWTFPMFWNRPIRAWWFFLLSLISPAAVYVRLFLGYNTPWQVFTGGLVGLGFAILFQGIMYFLVFPQIPWILSTQMASWLRLEDTLCYPTGTSRNRGDSSKDGKIRMQLVRRDAWESVIGGAVIPLLEDWEVAHTNNPNTYPSKGMAIAEYLREKFPSRRARVARGVYKTKPWVWNPTDIF